MKDLLKVFSAVMVLCAFVAGCGGGGGGGGVSSVDLIRPTILQVLPANGDKNVGTTTPIVITFSEPMDKASVEGAFSLTGGTNNAGTLSVNGSTATFTPSALTPLAPNTTYTATIAATAKDVAGNSLGSDHPWTFTTGTGPDVTPPTVQSYAPTGSSVDINSTIAMTFSEPMNTDSVKTAFTLKQGVTDVPGTISFTGNTAVFTPSAFLDYSKTYTATITTAAQDLANNGMAAPFTWDFTTSPPPALDTKAPVVSPGSEFPLDGSTGVPRDTPISVSFNEPITPFYYGSINGYPTRVDIDYTTNTVTMKPTALLTANTTYTVSIRVTDLAGNPMSTTSQWQFTTGATPTSLP